ncbi:uncharacterized protein BO87DRAFT_462595 [Aspergillus neoniger CBS 115656]|uniref:Uncharacterized protein n=1 Tax=Aspergillus neoniger (strain CBS 115656) TaxID=1448310 RepID=A0A318YYG1_ASPNB|nr:hypothetical protein BO87DRAFT_462595 [Aspergillus neoniger CBS 115656]PYH29972.1 hypothetical protein BO87DRAFT_462595 [Aspergillus neoniger CBS 115656]
MFFNKSVLAATLAVFASGVVGQLINIEYGTSEYDAYTQEVQLQDFEKLDYPGTYSYFSTPDICDLYSNSEDDATLSKVSGSSEIPSTYIEAVYCYTYEQEEELL